MKKQKKTVVQTVYEVVKFSPTQCPNCRNPFTRNSQGGYLVYKFWEHDLPKTATGFAKSFAFPGLYTDLISCGKCQNVTIRIMHARRLYEKKADAEKAVVREGFVNLVTAERWGKKKLRGYEQTLYLDAPLLEVRHIRTKPRRKRR